MSLEVIGAGFGRTGTLSLKLALERLGFHRCYHMYELLQNPDHLETWQLATRGEPVDWQALYRGYRASVDWPSCNFWEFQLQQFPDARVILTERDPESWYDSVRNTIYPRSLEALASEDAQQRSYAEIAFELIWEGTFHGRFEDREHAIDVYEAHNDYVKRQAPAERLLVFKAAQGWEPLCRFLGCQVPDEPYPRVNTTEEFLARVPGAPSAGA